VTCAAGMGSSGSLPSAGGIGNVGERRVSGPGVVKRVIYVSYG
jgi:hypothetical protein